MSEKPKGSQKINPFKNTYPAPLELTCPGDECGKTFQMDVPSTMLSMSLIQDCPYCAKGLKIDMIVKPDKQKGSLKCEAQVTDLEAAMQASAEKKKTPHLAIVSKSNIITDLGGNPLKKD